MKIIIEEGDVGGVPPGVYRASGHGAFIDTRQDPGEVTNLLRVNADVDMAQEPKPTPAGGRYDIEFRRFERVDPDDTAYEIFLHDRVDPDKTFTSRRYMANTLFMRYTLAESREMVQHELRRLALQMSEHLADQAIQAMGFSGNPFRTEAFTNHVKPTDPPPVATCNKTFADCAKHGNTLQYCGYVNVNTGRHVPCPHTFGDNACTGAKYLAPPAMPEFYNETPYSDPEVYSTADVEAARALSEKGFISHVLFPKTAAERAKTRGGGKAYFREGGDDCDVCYGTGRYKGMGGPCSEGCPLKGGN